VTVRKLVVVYYSICLCIITYIILIIRVSKYINFCYNKYISLKIFQYMLQLK